MSQTATWAVPSAPSGLAMRNTVNTIVDVLRSNSSGAAAPSPTVAGMFWFDESVSPAVLRQRNASNTAWNRVIDTADVDASRAALAAPPTPTTSAGLGQFTAIATASGVALVLPAGGTWAWCAYVFGSPAGSFIGMGAGVSAGGATIIPATPTYLPSAFCWRIA